MLASLSRSERGGAPQVGVFVFRITDSRATRVSTAGAGVASGCLAVNAEKLICNEGALSVVAPRLSIGHNVILAPVELVRRSAGVGGSAPPDESQQVVDLRFDGVDGDGIDGAIVEGGEVQRVVEPDVGNVARDWVGGARKPVEIGMG